MRDVRPFLKRPLTKSLSGKPRCVACGRPIFVSSDRVRLQGEAFHAECALYSRRR